MRSWARNRLRRVKSRSCAVRWSLSRSAGKARAESNVARKREAREWDERHGKLVDLSAFEHDILPKIQTIPLSQLQRATGLSLRYVSLIRRGERTPHPRHWEALLTIAASKNGDVTGDS